MELSVNGSRAYAWTAGTRPDPARPALLFVHGAGLDHTVWVLPGRWFARHGRSVLAVDLPAHGRSGGQPLESIETMADWLAALLDSARIERVAVAGHSMGSLVALELAARHPARVASLALLGTGLPMAVAEPLLASARADSHDAVEMLTVWGHSRHARIGGNENPGMWMFGVTMRLFERSRPGVLYADLDSCNRYQQGLESAARISCPTLLIVGAGDLMAPPRAAGAVAGAIAGARIVTLEGCGHAMLVERPEAVLDALIGIL